MNTHHGPASLTEGVRQLHAILAGVVNCNRRRVSNLRNLWTRISRNAALTHRSRDTLMTPNPPLSVPCLIVLVGPPGSGKTTWAGRNRRGTVHVSQDGLIDAITPAGFDHVFRPVYREAEDAVARAALQAGHTVIVDRTNRTRAHRERWLQIAREARCSAVAVVMTTPEALCRERNATRDPGRRLSEARMERMLAALEAVQPGEGFVSIHFESGVGDGISLEEILSQFQNKEQLSHEYCYQAR